MKYLLLLQISLILLVGCKKKGAPERPIFSNPQPLGIKEAKGFAKRYWGEYVSVEDSLLSILISSKVLVYKRSVNYTESKRALDTSSADIKAEFEKRKSEGELVARVQGDSIYIKRISSDTFFRLDEGNLLRYKNGEYYLNSEDEFGWSLQRLQLVKNKKLVIKNVTNAKDSVIKYIPTIKLDSVFMDYGNIRFAALDPSAKDFHTLMKLDVLNRKYGYTRKIKD